jgi:peptide alpha-N-acetyltransferase
MRARRRTRAATRLVRQAIERMRALDADLVVLETECSNAGALALYERLDFVRERRLRSYYLNLSDAFQLRLFLKPPAPNASSPDAESDGEL